MKRVVITGAGALSPLGHDWPTVSAALHSQRNAVRTMPDWAEVDGLNTRLAAPAQPFTLPVHYTTERTRRMGRVAVMAVRATELALIDSGLDGNGVLHGGRAGVAYGSSASEPAAMAGFARMVSHKDTTGFTADTLDRVRGDTAAIAITDFFDVRGRVLATSSACTSSSQAIGYSFEMIRDGRQEVMIAGGTEELSFVDAAVFDILFATSQRNDDPASTPRPFDLNRDGLVIGEGACTLILEDLDHALKRGASIYAEVIGYGTNSDGAHVTNPQAHTMAKAIEAALLDARVVPSQVGYICAHGTSTEQGDIAESHATFLAMGSGVPISSLKSYMGHTLGACGALEAWLSIEMMRAGWFAPTLNLEQIDPRCAPLDYIKGSGRQIMTDVVMSNNFAFGGINTSLIFKRW